MTASDFGRSLGNAVLKGIGRMASRLQEETPLSVDILESDDEFLVVFDAPGATASDIQVRYDDHAVRVRIDRFRDYHEGFETRVPGRGLSIDGEAPLPPDANVDTDAARAKLNDDGTLYVFLPKVEADGDRDVGERVAVEDGDDAA